MFPFLSECHLLFFSWYVQTLSIPLVFAAALSVHLSKAEQGYQRQACGTWGTQASTELWKWEDLPMTSVVSSGSDGMKGV